MTEAFAQQLSHFTPTTLSQLESVALLDRTDTKYLLTTTQLDRVLAALSDDYQALEIDGTRLHHYQTLYFDTAAFSLFESHHAGRAVRHKVRSRVYLDTGLSFLEVKSKNNKGRTVKRRLPTVSPLSHLDSNAVTFVDTHLPAQALSASSLEPVLWNEFFRVTLVSARHAERVTLDLGISFETAGGHDCPRGASHRAPRTGALPGIVIAEVKQSGIDRTSPFMRQMRALHLQPASVSKYCVGVSLLYGDAADSAFLARQLGRASAAGATGSSSPIGSSGATGLHRSAACLGVRHNAFKPTLRTLQKLMREASHVR